jgi:hypothetical protein
MPSVVFERLNNHQEHFYSQSKLGLDVTTGTIKLSPGSADSFKWVNGGVIKPLKQ